MVDTVQPAKPEIKFPLPTKKMPSLGPMLGSGAYKRAYENPTDPSTVILVSNRNDYDPHQEFSGLERMAKYGMPVVTWRDAFRADGSYVVVTEKAVGGCRDAWHTKERFTQLLNILNAKTIATGKKISTAIGTYGITNGDFQFLVGVDGGLMVNDPLAIGIAAERDGWRSTKRIEVHPTLAHFVRAAHFAEAVRAGKVTVKECFKNGDFYYWSDTIQNWWNEYAQNRREAIEREEAAAAAAMGIPTIYEQRVVTAE
jgi:hypothetical protein